MDRDEIFTQQLKAALSSEEIAAVTSVAGIAADYLRQRATDARQEVWEQFASEERSVMEAEVRLEYARAELRKAGFSIQWLNNVLSRYVGIRRRFLERLQQGVSDAQANLTIALDALKTALLQTGILPFIRAVISESFDSPYSTELRVDYSPGLSEVFDPRYEVTTKAARELSSILSLIRGGSIGLAGLRGSGKTTLIDSICKGRTKPFDRTILAFQASAPVKYEPRDFVLHLFATLCEALTGPTAQDDERYERAAAEEYLWRRRQRLVSLTLVSALVGLALIAIGILQITAHVKFPWLSGAIYIASGCALPFAVRMLLNISQRIRFPLGPRLRQMNYNFTLLDLGESERATFDELQRRALSLLDDIRYQQTYTSGWSGTLSVPVAAATLSGGQSWARQAMSYPDVVSELRDFLRDIAVGFRPIVVGIDELDKMESGEQARKFLNDIKGIFGINGCYFLISVSIDAMSSFERRGMPFRDAFDSSFDDIVSVSPLTYADARAVVNRRVIGVSDQFIALAFVISGGLARDLIRATRKLVSLANNNDDPDRTLRSLSARLVADDVAAKLAATDVALQRDVGSTWKDEILEVIHGLEPESESSLLIAARRLIPSVHVTSDEGGPTARLASDLATYLYFAATVVRYFDNSLGEQKLKEAESSGLLDKLAQSRQAFTMGPTAAWRKIDDCRSANGLETLPIS